MPRWRLVGALFGAASGAALACGGGGSADTGSPAPISRDLPPVLRDAPPASRDDPGPTRDNPNGPAAGGGGCIACGNFSCVGTANGQTGTAVITLTPNAGGCGVDNATLACDGRVYQNGAVVGTWTHVAGGGFSLCQQNVCAVCTPTSEH